jgi:hypothetical protein
MVIRRLFLGAGVGALGLGGLLLACNALLGIDSASPIDAAAPDGATGGDGETADADGSTPNSDTALESVNFANDPCGTYCAVVKRNCPAPYLEYLGANEGDAGDVCIKLCQVLARSTGDYRPFPGPNPPVEQEPVSEDTLGCRLWHAHKAEGDPATHCRHAGPLGSQACCTVPDGAAGCEPRPCEPFCKLDLAYCGGDRLGAVYGNMQGYCHSVCSSDAGFPYVAGSQGGSADGGMAFDLFDENGQLWESGDTLNCRLWHLQKALATGDLNFHCPHTDQDGGGACFGPNP